jgi:hypothetical protein
MNAKDVKIGHFYKLTIWDDDEPFLLACMGKEDGRWVMLTEEMDWETPWLIWAGDNDMGDMLEEVPMIEYIEKAAFVESCFAIEALGFRLR